MHYSQKNYRIKTSQSWKNQPKKRPERKRCKKQGRVYEIIQHRFRSPTADKSGCAAWKVMLIFSILVGAGVFTYYALPDKKYRVVYTPYGNEVAKTSGEHPYLPKNIIHSVDSDKAMIKSRWKGQNLEPRLTFIPKKVDTNDWQAKRSLLDKGVDLPQFSWEGKVLHFVMYTEERALMRGEVQVYNHPESKKYKVYDLILTLPDKGRVKHANHAVPLQIDLHRYAEPGAHFNVYYQATEHGLLKIGETVFSEQLKIRKKTEMIYRTIINLGNEIDYYYAYNQLRHQSKNGIVIPMPEKKSIYFQQCGRIEVKPPVFFIRPKEIDYRYWKEEKCIRSALSQSGKLIWAGKSLSFKIDSYDSAFDKAQFEIYQHEKKVYWIIFYLPEHCSCVEKKESKTISLQLDDYIEEGVEFHLYERNERMALNRLAEVEYTPNSFSELKCSCRSVEKEKDKAHQRIPVYYFEKSRIERYSKKISEETFEDYPGFFYAEQYLTPDPIPPIRMQILSGRKMQSVHPNFGNPHPNWRDQYLIFPLTFKGGGRTHSFRSRIMNASRKGKEQVFRIFISDETQDAIKENVFTRLCIDLKTYAEKGTVFEVYQKMPKGMLLLFTTEYTGQPLE